MSEKLQKVLARLGLGSRREIEKWIQAGRIKVDGKIATLGDRVTPQQKINVDNKPTTFTQAQTTQLLIYHKPIGEVCTRSDPEGRPTVFKNLPQLSQGRWIAIGRLDVQTSGLLLFTTNGELANRLMHPKNEYEREYAVRIYGKVSENILKSLRQGVTLEDGLAKFTSIKDMGGKGANHWFHVTLCEGRNRIVRRLWDSQGLKINRLIRIRFGSIRLPDKLAEGECKRVNPNSL